jgi:ribosomal protein S7
MLLFIFGPRVRSNKLFLEFMYKVKLLSNLSPLYVLEEALENVRPAFELRTKKVAATKYNIPFLLTAERADSFCNQKTYKEWFGKVD